MNDLPDIPPALRRDKNNIAPVFAKPLVYSYTNLHTFDDTCQYQFYRTYAKKDIPYIASKEMDWGKRVHTAMEHRIGGGKPLPEDMRHWEPIASALADRKPRVEMKLGITGDGRPTGFYDKDVRGRGTLDVVLVNNNTAMLFDHKTGGSKYESPFELEIHAMLLKAANPNLIRVTGSFIWLKENRVGTPHDLSDFSGTWARVNNLVEEIEDRMLGGEWEKKKGPLCAYCRVFDCENNSNLNK
jgi:hypothetical protein